MHGACWSGGDHGVVVFNAHCSLVLALAKGAYPSIYIVHVARVYATFDFMQLLMNLYSTTLGRAVDLRRTILLIWQSSLDRELLSGTPGSRLSGLPDFFDQTLPHMEDRCTSSVGFCIGRVHVIMPTLLSFQVRGYGTPCFFLWRLDT